LGSTGTVGENTLAVIAQHPQYRVFALTANENVDKLQQQCLQYQPQYAVVVNKALAPVLQNNLRQSGSDTEVLAGHQALVEVSEHTGVDAVMAAIVGAAGLLPTLAAVNSGKKVLLANKEALVMAGDLFMQAVANSGTVLLPIDSEHNAIFQCLPIESSAQQPLQAKPHGQNIIDRVVKKVILTASGGPFLHTASEQLQHVTPAQACKHPNWVMGKKISVDSATMMNKGLEYIEACNLFGLDMENLEVLVHPQSIVHSMVEYVDGSVIAQLAAPDMRVPIAYGLAWPDRINSGAEFLDLVSAPPLEFMQPDLVRFRCLKLGMEAAAQGGTAPALLNAANEVAVAAFLQGRIGFCEIPVIIEKVLEEMPCEAAQSLDIIQAADNSARVLGNKLVNKVN